MNAAIRPELQKPNGPLTEQDLLSLTNLDAGSREVTSIEGLDKARNLRTLYLFNNQLTNFTLSGGLTDLRLLDLSFNSLTRCFLPAGLTNLETLLLAVNQLTNLMLPAGLIHLAQLDLGENQLSDFVFPRGLTNLSTVDLDANQLNSLTLPQDLTNLASLFVAGNPLVTFVFAEPMATGSLNALVGSLQSKGVSMFAYPLTAQLIRLRQPLGAFQFVINGPPGAYTILDSTNLADWSELGIATNSLGKVVFTDGTAHLSPQKFYRAHSP